MALKDNRRRSAGIDTPLPGYSARRGRSQGAAQHRQGEEPAIEDAHQFAAGCGGFDQRHDRRVRGAKDRVVEEESAASIKRTYKSRLWSDMRGFQKPRAAKFRTCSLMLCSRREEIASLRPNLEANPLLCQLARHSRITGTPAHRTSCERNSNVILSVFVRTREIFAIDHYNRLRNY